MTPKLSTLRECATERVRSGVRFFWRKLWTWAVHVTGDSRLTLFIEGRYERALLAWG